MAFLFKSRKEIKSGHQFWLLLPNWVPLMLNAPFPVRDKLFQAKFPFQSIMQYVTAQRIIILR